jgi:hypothetical protein
MASWRDAWSPAAAALQPNVYWAGALCGHGVPEWKGSQMNHRRRMLAGLATAGTALALLPAAASGAAPNPVEQGTKLCLRQDAIPSSSTTGYQCTTQPPEQQTVAPPFSSRDLDQAGRLCGRNGGTFVVVNPQTYTCTFPV